MADPHPHRFATTRWSLVLAARDGSTLDGQAALASLCESYWHPVYAYVRRTGRSTDDARDLTQSFFTRVLEKGTFDAARPERGRFRSFLLTAVRHFLANEHDWATAQKRGGGQTPRSLEFDDGEARYLQDVTDDATPETIYERRWALTTLDTALDRVGVRYADRGRAQLFAQLRPLLTGREPDSYADLAASIGVSDGALRVAVHRLRQQFGTCLREVVAETVDRPEGVDEELQYLLTIVSRSPARS